MGIFIVWIKLKREISIKMDRIVMNEERQLTSLKSERNPNIFIRKLPFSENDIEEWWSEISNTLKVQQRSVCITTEREVTSHQKTSCIKCSIF